MIEWFTSLDPNTQTAFWIILIGAMTNTACALLGCYLVLRRMSMLGDALSHAVLPGLVVAFVLTGSLGIYTMFIGALAAGILTAVLVHWLHRGGGVPEDASMGVVFTALFALGVVLIKRYASAVDLDIDCVFSGVLDMVDLNTVRIGGFDVPRALVSIGPVLALNVLVILLFWKELLLSSFDSGLATAMGFKAGFFHYLLMVLVAMTTVASFEQVGSILVVAMLIAPGATAHLLTDKLGRMMGIAAGLAVASAVLGHFAAVYLNVNTAGMMAVVVGLFYLAAVLLAPRYGVLSALVRNLQMSVRVVREDLLGMLYRLEELGVERRLGRGEAIEAVGRGPLARLALRGLLRRGDVKREGHLLELTDRGREQATGLVRAHRLWEAYLVEHLGLPPDHVHEPAMRTEHYLGAALQERVAAEVADAETDPHGREIPS